MLIDNKKDHYPNDGRNITTVWKSGTVLMIHFESEIDRLVYQLYGLTYDEVLIVDSETPITR